MEMPLVPDEAEKFKAEGKEPYTYTALFPRNDVLTIRDRAEVTQDLLRLAQIITFRLGGIASETIGARTSGDEFIKGLLPNGCGSVITCNDCLYQSLVAVHNKLSEVKSPPTDEDMAHYVMFAKIAIHELGHAVHVACDGAWADELPIGYSRVAERGFDETAEDGRFQIIAVKKRQRTRIPRRSRLRGRAG
jgi:hypothetical protein